MKTLTAAKRRRPTTQKMLALYAESYDFGDHQEVRLTTPLRLVSEANQREHWSVKYRRKQDQQSFMWQVLPLAGRFMQGAAVKLIRLERIGRKMDSDNAVGAFKHVQDAIAKWLGADDGDLEWHYEQSVDADGCKGLRVTFELAGPE
jgi:hypothetical protein